MKWHFEKNDERLQLHSPCFEFYIYIKESKKEQNFTNKDRWVVYFREHEMKIFNTLDEAKEFAIELGELIAK